ncbi:HU family DNA-binding protein [Marinoscillum sp.]|uniref:HU family DNA-binding protein n=1 Tax=Marinoscillum sp. TaxID=2024838 RepID=UPI003BACB212
MAVSYKVVSKRPGGLAGENPPKYYPVVTKRSLVDTRDLAEEISSRNSFSTADVIGIIESLIQMVPEKLQQGSNVRLDGFGTFSLHVSAVGQEDPAKVTKRDITKVKMAFLPSKHIKKKLTGTTFTKVPKSRRKTG